MRIISGKSVLETPGTAFSNFVCELKEMQPGETIKLMFDCSQSSGFIAIKLAAIIRTINVFILLAREEKKLEMTTDSPVDTTITCSLYTSD